MSKQSFVQNSGMIMEVTICPKELMDKQAVSSSKAPEKTFATNEYFCVLGRHNNEGKVSLAHENH